MRDLVTCQAKWVLWSPPSARQTSLTLESSDDHCWLSSRPLAVRILLLITFGRSKCHEPAFRRQSSHLLLRGFQGRKVQCLDPHASLFHPNCSPHLPGHHCLALSVARLSMLQAWHQAQVRASSTGSVNGRPVLGYTVFLTWPVPSCPVWGLGNGVAGGRMETPSRLAQSSCRLSRFFQGWPRASPAMSGSVANANRGAGGGPGSEHSTEGLFTLTHVQPWPGACAALED